MTIIITIIDSGQVYPHNEPRYNPAEIRTQFLSYAQLRRVCHFCTYDDTYVSFLLFFYPPFKICELSLVLCVTAHVIFLRHMSIIRSRFCRYCGIKYTKKVCAYKRLPLFCITPTEISTDEITTFFFTWTYLLMQSAGAP